MIRGVMEGLGSKVLGVSDEGHEYSPSRIGWLARILKLLLVGGVGETLGMALDFFECFLWLGTLVKPSTSIFLGLGVGLGG